MTTLEQSKALYEIFGEVETEKVWEERIDAEAIFGETEYRKLNGWYGSRFFPAHSTDTLLDLLPAEIDDEYYGYVLRMGKNDAGYFKEGTTDTWLVRKADKGRLHNLTDLTIWLNKNGYYGNSH